MDLDKLAAHLIARFNAANDPNLNRPDGRLATAKFEAGCDAVYAAGFGMTPFMIQMDVRDAISAHAEAVGPRPEYHAVNNAEQQGWDAGAASLLSAKLGERLPTPPPDPTAAPALPAPPAPTA